jgi:CHAT domain-containing protein
MAFALAAVLLNCGAAAEPAPNSADLLNEAFENAQRAMSGAAASALAQLGARFAVGSDDLARIVRQRQDLIESWRKADRLLVQSLASPSGFSNLEELRGNVGRLQDAVATSDKEIAERFPAYSDLASPKPITIGATQKLLDADEGLVLILVGKKESFTFGVTRERSEAHRIPVGYFDLLPRVKALRQGLNPASPAVMRSGMRSFGETVVESGETNRLVFERSIAYQLYRDFLAPLDSMMAAKKRLFFVLESPFDSLPLALLVTEPPQGADTDPAALRATSWLLKRQALAVLPSVGSLKALRANAALTRAREPFRGYGAPLIGSPSARVAAIATRSAGTSASVYKGGRIDVEAVRSLAELPKTAGELARLATALGAPPDAVRIGAAATVPAIKADDLSRFRVLAFATHGLLAGELSGLAEPALVFTPPANPTDDDYGLLTASDAAKLRLAADWVILSACNTAAGDGTPGADGLSGLARAFFYAGAKSLLVSHWPVRDDAAARITTETFAALAKSPSIGKADAFRNSVLALLNDTSDPTFAHPAIWAPFIVVGEGR